jgi:hypothetical protein
MNDLLDITLLVLGLLAGMSALLYVLAALDPQSVALGDTATQAGVAEAAQSR